MTWLKWLFDYYDNRAQNGERLGQAFCNDYIRSSWPELYYCEDEGKCVKMVTQWLNDCQYYGDLPAKAHRN